MDREAITEDILQKDDTKTLRLKKLGYVECHSCGEMFRKENGYSHTGITGHKGLYNPMEVEPTEKEFTVWCCSKNCLQWFHERNPSYKAQRIWSSKSNPKHYLDHTGKPMKLTKTGFLVSCANCEKEFNSKGLRCCSRTCEKELRARFKAIGIGKYEDLPSKLYKNLERLRSTTETNTLETIAIKEIIAA